METSTRGGVQVTNDKDGNGRFFLIQRAGSWSSVTVTLAETEAVLVKFHSQVMADGSEKKDKIIAVWGLKVPAAAKATVGWSATPTEQNDEGVYVVKVTEPNATDLMGNKLRGYWVDLIELKEMTATKDEDTGEDTYEWEKRSTSNKPPPPPPKDEEFPWVWIAVAIAVIAVVAIILLLYMRSGHTAPAPGVAAAPAPAPAAAPIVVVS